MGENMKTYAFRCLVPVVALAFALGAGAASASNSPAQKVDDKPSYYKVDNQARGRDGLPTIANGSPPSEARKTMDALLARANQEGKKLVLVVSAAWCGPCAQFWQEIAAHPNYIQELHNSGYLLAKAEYEKMVVGAGADYLTLNDYLPANVSFFPAFYLYANGKWTSIGTVNSYSDLKDILASNPSPLSYEEAKKAIQSTGNGKSTNRIYRAMFGGFSNLYSYDEARDLIDTLKKTGNQDYQSIAEFMQNGMWTYVGIGALDIASFTYDYPDQGAALSDLSRDDFNGEPFNMLLEKVWRTNGLKSAAAQCEAMWSTYKNQFVPGKLSASEFQAKLAKYDLVTKVACLHLQMLGEGSLTPALKAQVDALDKAKIKDWSLLAADGEITQAIAIYHARYQANVDSYNKSLASAQKALDKAKASGDKAKIDEAQAELDVEKFRIQYHAEVDASAEAAIQAGAPVNPVHEFQ